LRQFNAALTISVNRAAITHRCSTTCAFSEAYGDRSRSAGEERVEAVARHSSWRRAEAEVHVVLPVR
jgi:hypothetical protein